MLLLGLAAGAWLLFFPVPLGWAVRLGLARALPPDGPLRVDVAAVTFRWRWGEPTLQLEIRGLDATARSRPLAKWRELIIEVPKAGLWQRQFAPARILLREPFVTLDQTAEGALALLPSSKSPGASAPPDVSALAPVLPAPGAAALIVVEGAAVRLRNAAGEALLPLGEIRTTLARQREGPLGLEVDLPLGGGATAPRLTARAALDPRTLRGDFSLGLPAFSTAEIPAVPGAPPLPFQGALSLEASGHFDLAEARLLDAAGGLVVTEADVALPPDLAARHVRLDRLEVRGRIDVRTRRVVLETGRVRAGAFELNVRELEAALGDRPQARWRLEASGLKGAELRRLLAAAHRARIPLPDDAIDAIDLERLTLAGRGEVGQDPGGVWSAQAMQLDGRVELALGREPVVCTWSARQARQDEDIKLELALPRFAPGRWPPALLAGTPAAAFDLPLTLAAQATISAAGEPRGARLTLTGGAGTVKSLQAGLPALDIRRLEVNAESDRFDRAWRLPTARLELAGGAGLELVNARAEIAPSQIAAEGEIKARRLAGEFITQWLPPDAWAPLTARNLPPHAAALDDLALRFKAVVGARPAGGWEPRSLSADATARVRLNAARLGLAIRAALPEADAPLDALLTVEEFRPAELGLLMSDGLTTDQIDFPLSLRASAQAGRDGRLLAAGVQLRAGAGRVRLPPALGEGEVPVKGVALDASYVPAQARAEVKSLRIEAAGLQLDLAEIVATTAPPHAVNGRIELAPFALRPLLARWPPRWQPELRRTVESSLRAGDFLGGRFEWAVRLDPTSQPMLAISRFAGEARLAALDAVHGAVPGPVTIGQVTAKLDFPRAVVGLRDVTVPGVRLAAVQADLTGLDRPGAAVSVAAKFEADMIAANRAWRLAPEGLANGIISGEVTAEAPLDLGTAQARVALDLRRAQLKLPGFVKAVPDQLAVGVRAARPLAQDQPLAADFSLETSAWLGEPMRVAGRAVLSAGDRRPEAIEVSAFEHGRTRLQASYRQPAATQREIAIKGPRLNLAPLLRAGLAAADALSARPVAPASAPTAESDSPGTVRIDASIGEIEFGAGRTARAFELHTRLERNWPVDFSLASIAGADVALSATLTGPVDRQVFKFSITDASGWMSMLMAPWNETPPAPGQFGSLVAQLIKVPTIVAGGAVSLEAEMRRGEDEWLRGRLQLRRAAMIRAPYMLQLLANKSGRSLQDSPTIEDFSVGKLTLSRTSLVMTDTSLAGSGLIDRIKLKSASYGLADEALKVDGEYFGVGFDILGTRADPRIFLKDSNPVIRAIGTRNEFNFDEPPPAPPKKP